VLACSTIGWNSTQWAQGADATYVGEIASKEPIGFSREEAAQASIRSVNYRVILVVEAVLFGEETDEVSFEMDWCGGGTGEEGERVVVFRLGDSWHVRNSEDDIAQAHEAVSRMAEGSEP
jgi:hypothetical protein